MTLEGDVSQLLHPRFVHYRHTNQRQWNFHREKMQLETPDANGHATKTTTDLNSATIQKAP
jgi:hypothetical protein